MKIKRYCGNMYDPYAENAKMYFIYSLDAQLDRTGFLRKYEWEDHVKRFDSMIHGAPRFKRRTPESAKKNMVGLYHEMFLFDFIKWSLWYFLTFKVFMHTKLFAWLVGNKPKEREI